MKSPKILLGISGGIAAYKSAELCRSLIKQGCDVRVVMTASACEFIAPLTFQALSGNPVHTELLDADAEAGMGHIELAKWPDLVLVAPATAGLISRYEQAAASDLLSTILIATEAPVALAPAMNQAMWSHPATQKNMRSLSSMLGSQLMIWGPAEGQQACGDVGPGRVLEPEQLAEKVAQYFMEQSSAPSSNGQGLLGRKVVITAGPTREAIDPVRYVSNHSSGKMGFALAQACLDQGAAVTIVAGPVNIEAPKGSKVVSIVSANDMMSAVTDQLAQGCDVFIASAAVADYRPVAAADQKIKKTGDSGTLVVEMVQNPDIVASVAASSSKPFVVGFAAETNDVEGYAKNKLERKKLDMIVANDVSKAGIGFNSDQNEVHVITRTQTIHLAKAEKSDLAREIILEIIEGLKS